MQIGEFKDNSKSAIIAIDFDGTINLTNDYPRCGQLRPYADVVIRKFNEHDVKVVIWTCRDDENSLGLMADFLENCDIPYNSINSSIRFAPFEYESRKIYAHMYVDDRGFGWQDTDNIMLSVYKEFMVRYTDVDSDIINAEISQMMIEYNSKKECKIENMLEKYIIYTDGGCWNTNGMGAWAYTVLDTREDEHPLWSASQRILDSTNNRAEMLAIIEGIQALPRGCKVDVYTDSGYVQFGFTRPNYLKSWMNNDWKSSTNKPVKNQDLWEIIVLLSTQYNIHMYLVSGHNKDKDTINRKWNTLVDKMCTAEMEYFKTVGLVTFGSQIGKVNS